MWKTLEQGEETTLESHFLLFFHTMKVTKGDNFIGCSKPNTKKEINLG